MKEKLLDEPTTMQNSVKPNAIHTLKDRKNVLLLSPKQLAELQTKLAADLTKVRIVKERMVRALEDTRHTI